MYTMITWEETEVCVCGGGVRVEMGMQGKKGTDLGELDSK